MMMSIGQVIEKITSGECKRIAFLTGAGMSVNAGIPDFRSPGGMYDTLKPELLTATENQRMAMTYDPTYVVSRELFAANQFGYLELRRPFILGLGERKWQPTIGHWFVRLCHEKGILTRLYTQNIDGLDYMTGVPSEKIVSVHGSMGQASCEFCEAPYDIRELERNVRTNIRDIYGVDESAPNESTNILCPQCKQAGVKPKTVLYGSSLPRDFFTCAENDFPAEVDMLFIVGTSLTVSPANSLVNLVNDKCPRIVINRERVGEWAIPYDSSSVAFLDGNCDDVFLDLIVKLQWLDELRQHENDICENGRKLIEKAISES